VLKKPFLKARFKPQFAAVRHFDTNSHHCLTWDTVRCHHCSVEDHALRRVGTNTKCSVWLLCSQQISQPGSLSGRLDVNYSA